MRQWKFTLATGIAALLLAHAAGAAYDHTHAAWSALLGKHVVPINDGNASQVRYAAFKQDRATLKTYLASLSAISEAEFQSWDKPRQMAFLINAYNAFTVEKILTRYPDLKSIRDFGTVFGDAWKDKFFKLLGRDSTLNQIEHEWLRRPGNYDEPRIHFAVNCASVGCPLLRAEAYVADQLDRQLEDQTRRFLADRSRNRYNAQKGVLEVSRLFDWYKEDWTSGYQGMVAGAPAISTREQFFARYARLLADKPEHQALIAGRKVAITHLDYDWTLNDDRP